MSGNYISPKAKVAEDVDIGEFVKLLGSVRIGRLTKIDDMVLIGVPPTSFDFRQDIDYDYMKTTIGECSRIMRGSIISAGVSTGNNFFCDYGCYVGIGTEIGNDVILTYRAQVYDRVKIGDNTLVGGFVGDRSIVGRNVTTYGKLIHKYNFSKEKRPVLVDMEEPSPTVEDYAVVGFDALLIGGITVGEGAFVAAGTVVTKNVEPNDVVAGNPARSIKDRVKFV